MKKILLPFGATEIDLELPGPATLLEADLIRTALDDKTLSAALAAPIGTPSLTELARTAKNALIVLSDATRIARADLLLPHLLTALQEGGLCRERVTLLIGGGNHRPATAQEIATIAGPACLGLRIVQHDSADAAELVPLAPTRRGTQAALNRLLFAHDLVITISAVNAHYFAGFGGGRKSIFPGVAGRDGIVANHLLSIDFRSGKLADGVETCRLEGNPVDEDIMEIVEQRPPQFSINTLLTPDGRIGALYCGHWIAAHRAACATFLEHHAVPIAERRNWAVVSAGGHPKDIDLIQSHKSIQNAGSAVKPGGGILLVARCADGLGSEGFERFFPLTGVAELLADIRARNPKNGQTALALSQKTWEFRIGLLSELNAELVRNIGMTPLADGTAATAWLARECGGSEGYLIPHAAVTIPRLHAG